MICGKGPLDNSEAKDLLEAIAPVLDCFDPFRDEDIDADEDDVAYAELSATVLSALAATGIDALPADRDVLVAEGNLTETMQAALTADIAIGRPPFARESSVERWLREGGARYHVWMFAAGFDDRAAAWAAADNAEALCVMARLAGVPAVDLGRAFTATLVELFGNEAEPLAQLATDGAIELDVPAWRSGRYAGAVVRLLSQAPRDTALAGRHAGPGTLPRPQRVRAARHHEDAGGRALVRRQRARAREPAASATRSARRAAAPQQVASISGATPSRCRGRLGRPHGRRSSRGRSRRRTRTSLGRRPVQAVRRASSAVRTRPPSTHATRDR